MLLWSSVIWKPITVKLDTKRIILMWWWLVCYCHFCAHAKLNGANDQGGAPIKLISKGEPFQWIMSDVFYNISQSVYIFSIPVKDTILSSIARCLQWHLRCPLFIVRDTDIDVWTLWWPQGPVIDISLVSEADMATEIMIKILIRDETI